MNKEKKDHTRKATKAKKGIVENDDFELYPDQFSRKGFVNNSLSELKRMLNKEVK